MEICSHGDIGKDTRERQARESHETSAVSKIIMPYGTSVLEKYGILSFPSLHSPTGLTECMTQS